ncbi:hypothetical protein [Roseivirga sp. 4D4]|uniref:hypothetical protein n=1 Tax=Roseivirga sp. 4D4 TaxID=1889784 RepID=UPI001480EC81|nr:hypothetical protein [Roseivirga sp. 4D4]
MYRIHNSYKRKAVVIYFDQGLSKDGQKEDHYYVGQKIVAQREGETAKHLGVHDKQVTREVFAGLVNKKRPKRV